MYSFTDELSWWKFQITNPKKQTNYNDRNSKFETYDIEESMQIQKDILINAGKIEMV